MFTHLDNGLYDSMTLQCYDQTFLHNELYQCVAVQSQILFCHHIEVSHEIALRLRELSVLPPFRANSSHFMSYEHFQQ